MRVTTATIKNLEALSKKDRSAKIWYYPLELIHIQTLSLRDVPEGSPVVAKNLCASPSRDKHRAKKVHTRDGKLAHATPGNAWRTKSNGRRR
jgi:DNA-binding NtrC family response regulator